MPAVVLIGEPELEHRHRAPIQFLVPDEAGGDGVIDEAGGQDSGIQHPLLLARAAGDILHLVDPQPGDLGRLPLPVDDVPDG